VSQVISNAEAHRVQIIYTHIARDANGNPTFTTHPYRLHDDEYFYPASTVKLPTALAALELVKKLNITGLNSRTHMLTGAAYPWQSAATEDPSAPGGYPSIAYYVQKILWVSDNDAYNRLYELLGPKALDNFLENHGLNNTRIVHRLEQSLSQKQNRQLNPIRFREGETTVYELAARTDPEVSAANSDILLGQAEIINGERIKGAKNFRAKNAFSLQDQHELMKALMFPNSVAANRRFVLSDIDRTLLLEAMSTPPSASGIADYADRSRYPDGYVKFLMLGGDAQSIPDSLTIYNKSGQAYGFLTDMAYFVDEQRGVEFLLGATIYANQNGVFNDDVYEYDSVGFPFMAALGKAIYQLELARRPSR